MKTRNIKTIIAFAQSRGMMAMSVTEVIKAFGNMKYYHRPRVRVQEYKCSKCQLSWEQMNDLLNIILERKKGISKLLDKFEINASIVIGGSLSLKYTMKNFIGRDFHDVDLIINPSSEEDKTKLRKVLQLLIAAGTCKCNARYYTVESCSFELGNEIEVLGKSLPVNIIIGEIGAYLPHKVFNSPHKVFKAKEEYIKRSRAIGTLPRPKDLLDIYNAYK